MLNACEGGGHFGRRFSVQTVRPVGKRTVPAEVEIFAYFDHSQW
jgi:hypothetical protein